MPRNEFQARDWEDPEDEDLSQEVPPVEEPQEVYDGIPLAGLRKLMGLSTTRAHIAQIKAKSDPPTD